jgi:biotin carboxyl carrier protein
MARSTRYLVTVRGHEIGVELSLSDDGRVTARIEGPSGKTFEVGFLRDGASAVLSVDRQVVELISGSGELRAGGERKPVGVESRSDGEKARATKAARPGPVRAPMPGRIVKVLVEPGAALEKGAGIVVVEAMKMENELVAPRACVVERVLVKAGDAVERNAVLVEIR